MGKLNLETEEKILLLSRIGRFIKRMLKIKFLSQEIQKSPDYESLRKSTKDKVEDIEILSSKKEND